MSGPFNWSFLLDNKKAKEKEKWLWQKQATMSAKYSELIETMMRVAGLAHSLETDFNQLAAVCNTNPSIPMEEHFIAQGENKFHKLYDLIRYDWLMRGFQIFYDNEKWGSKKWKFVPEAHVGFDWNIFDKQFKKFKGTKEFLKLRKESEKRVEEWEKKKSHI